ncbi:MAG: hypothetical protein DME20_09605 [Verrucomicrobia bacterium]|nr:MAG: hypothetical protein DME92_03525 [Verrucomicrobiota bacterium]PYJ91817.1 MAG: hypothetical protein DME71_01115 [Verrucomicrobiota bacterium]PYK48216.1 MAG: hypothetical protein DME20_09605 [Verrucomicrobiota bacterium]
MKAISTLYKGRQYRSRLEARWAAFFDLLGWHTEYEPIDFDGWIPDFVINEAGTVYVEVKPIDRFPDRDITDKIDNSGCDKEVLVVGSTVPIHSGLIGWLREDLRDVTDSDEPYWIWAGPALGIWVGSETNSERGRYRKETVIASLVFVMKNIVSSTESRGFMMEVVMAARSLILLDLGCCGLKQVMKFNGRN